VRGLETVRRLWHGAPDFGVVFEPSALSPRLAQAKLLREQLLELQTRVDVAEQARQALADDRLLCVRSLKHPFQSALFELMTAYPPASGHPGLAPGAPPGWQGAASNLRLYLECGGTLSVPTRVPPCLTLPPAQLHGRHAGRVQPGAAAAGVPQRG